MIVRKIRDFADHPGALDHDKVAPIIFSHWLHQMQKVEELHCARDVMTPTDLLEARQDPVAIWCYLTGDYAVVINKLDKKWVEWKSQPTLQRVHMNTYQLAGVTINDVVQFMINPIPNRSSEYVFYLFLLLD